MELGRRDFLKGCAGLAALAAWGCKGGEALPRQNAAQAAPSGKVIRVPTVLRAGGRPYGAEVEVWGSMPMGIRGNATLGLLDWLPLFWLTDSRVGYRLHGRDVGPLEAAGALKGKLSLSGHHKPLLVAVPPVSSLPLLALLEKGASRGAWVWAVAGPGREDEWNLYAGLMRKKAYGGMLSLGLHAYDGLPAGVRAAWELAPWKAACAMDGNTWTRTAQLAWPMPHPFASADLHRLPDGAPGRQSPLGELDPKAAGAALLLSALEGLDWYPGLWSSWMEGARDVSESRLAFGDGSLEQEIEKGESPWLREALYGLEPMPEEPRLELVRVPLPTIQEGRRWGMAVDLDLCDACGACMLACMLENNVPCVGPLELQRGRGMHWLRVAQGIPLMCQQCALAPCEAACPVHASSHSPDGLNEQTYARCIGSRYCAVHCPWKTRRFNFGVPAREGVQIQFNPRVPLRPRGVMEKCTFCQQRLRGAYAQDEPLTACAEACSRGAIHFGDWNDASSPLRKALAGRTLWRLASSGAEEPGVLYLRESHG